MIIYPAIDLMDAAAVRLEQGRFSSKKVYDQDPLELALDYQKQGATHLHVVDLDGAKAKEPKQLQQVKHLAQKTQLQVQAGGGIRTLEHIHTLVDAGVHRVIIGSLAVRQPDLIVQFLKEIGGEKLTIALDIRINEQGVPMVASEGWQNSLDGTLWQFLAFYRDNGAQHILCTDIHRDGMFSGPNIALYQKMVEKVPTMKVQASGGVATVDNVQAAKDVGCHGMIIGKALLEGRFTLREALDVS